ncbi:MAG: porin family protein [Alphaproteobacteria bacterium]|nr:porin family protein [Alphaproteobacteria bacterium]
MKNTIATLLVAVSAFAMNANAADFRPYVGVDYNYDNGNGNDFNSGTVNVGTQFNDYFGTEVFYQKSDSDVKTYGELRQQTRSFDAYGIDFNGYLPMGCEQEFALIGSLGVGEYTFNTGYNVAANLNNRDHGIGYRFGLGGLYNVTNNVALKAMARYVKFNKLADETEETDMMEYTAGVRYNF